MTATPRSVSRAGLRALQAAVMRVPSDYWLLWGVFGISRLVLRGLGLQFSLQLDWMFLDDPALLQNHLWQSLVNFNAYPPGMNFLTGILLKLSDGNLPGLTRMAQALYTAWGVGLAGVTLYVFRAAGWSRRSAFLTAAIFSNLPQILYFEKLYLYTYLVVGLLAAGAASLHYALAREARWAWSAFFWSGAVLCVTRSTFHLVWFVAMLALSLLVVGPGARGRVVLHALAPAALVLALYTKNYVRFDAFAATTAGGGNMSLITVARMPPELRHEWVLEGKLSPIAEVNVYSPPRAYLPYFGDPNSKRWPELSALEHSNGAPNFNHWFFMEANRLRAKDARVVIRERPWEYARTAISGLVKLFEPSTHWHPHTGRESSPHAQHYQVLGPYVDWYRKWVHSFPAPLGLYWALPVGIVAGLVQAWRLRRPRTPEERARLGLLLFAGFQVLFVVAVSSLFTYYEASRYRVQIELFIWLLIGLAVRAFVSERSPLRSSSGSREPAPIE